MKTSALIAALLCAGCASHSGIAPAGGDTLMITKQAATGLPGLGNMKAEVLTEANAHCVGKGKTMEVLNVHETKPPYVLGNYPRVDLMFRCR